MADHPFKGKWSSYTIQGVNQPPYYDGTIDLDIDPNGTFKHGKHTPPGASDVVLRQNSISPTDIDVEETGGLRCRYVAHITSPVGATTMVAVGYYVVPRAVDDRFKNDRRAFVQDDGIWVATKP